MKKSSKKLLKCNNSKNKKGLIALDSLIGIVLSTIALVLVVKIIADLFLQTHSNLDIAKSQANSIKEFVDFSLSKYKSSKECYTMLKLSNLENFQFEEIKSQNNYFYVIGEKNKKMGVFIISINYLPELQKSNSLKNIIYNDFIKFENQVSLKNDLTDNSKFTFDFYFTSIGKLGTNLELSPNQADFLILVPKFNRDILFGIVDDFPILDSNQNLLVGLTNINNEIQPTIGFNLGLNTNTNELFLSKSEFSNMFLNYKSCAVKDYNNNHYEKYIYDNPEFADFYNDELIFDLVDVNGKKYDYEFAWKINNIKCPTNDNKDCDFYLGSGYKDLTYLDFVKKVNKAHLEIFSVKFDIEDGKSKLVKINRIPINEIKIFDSDLHYNIENIFNVYEYENLDNKKSLSIVKDDLKVEFKTLYSEYNRLRNKKEVCNNVYCDFIGLPSSISYFYNSDLNKFVSFNTRLLRKDEQENIYFEGKKLILREEEVDKVGSWFGDREFRLYDILTQNGIRTIILSSYQYASVEVEVS